MPGTVSEIPAWPVLLPLTAAAAAVVLWSLRRRGALTVVRVVTTFLACGYAAAVLDAVFFPFEVATGGQANDVPWWVYVQPVPLVTADPVGLVLNVALFVPVGLLLPLVARAGSFRRVAATALGLSLAVEMVQLVADVAVSTGRVFDVDDLIGNTLGAVAGFGLFRIAVTVPPVARFVRAATWPAGPRGAVAPAEPVRTLSR